MNLGSASAFLVAVSFVTPVAATSYIDAQATAAYVQPVTSVSYIDARVQAVVSFPDVYGIEVVTPTDLVALTTTKGFSESVSQLDEIQAFDFTKGLFESPAITESIITSLVFIRNFSDTATLLDEFTRGVLPDDTIGSVDTYVSSFSKPFNEAIALLDNMDGDIEFQLVKTTSDSLAANDTQTLNVSVVKSENTTLNSSGVLAMQDYSDITYFAEDYVGIARTFT
jgi:hypothetical protein